MSEVRFTPGPYRADGPDPFGDWNILHSADSLAVAAVVSNMRAPTEVAANARLIAAAPELFEALSELMVVLRKEAPGTPLNNHRFDALGIKANKALSKALGSSP